MDERPDDLAAAARAVAETGSQTIGESISHGFFIIQDMFDHANERIRALEARVEALEPK